MNEEFPIIELSLAIHHLTNIALFVGNSVSTEKHIAP
jgi:hypothetical protein